MINKHKMASSLLAMSLFMAGSASNMFMDDFKVSSNHCLKGVKGNLPKCKRKKKGNYFVHSQSKGK